MRPLVTLTLASLLALLGCEFSTTKLPASPAELRVEVDVERRSERRGSARHVDETGDIRAILRNRKGTAIESADIKLLVNGVPLRFLVGQGNYYDRHPFYRLPSDAPVGVRDDSTYRFTLVWIDGTEHPIGTVRTPPPLALAQFALPDAHPRGRDLEIRWRDLAGRAELVVYRTMEVADSAGNVGYVAGSALSEDALRETVGPGRLRSWSGVLRVPASYLADSAGQRVATLGVAVTATSDGKVEKPFASGSYIRAVRALVLRVDVEEVADTAASGDAGGAGAGVTDSPRARPRSRR